MLSEMFLLNSVSCSNKLMDPEEAAVGLLIYSWSLSFIFTVLLTFNVFFLFGSFITVCAL